MKARIYGKTLNKWVVDGKLEQVEIAYTEYCIDKEFCGAKCEKLRICGTGSEDFSPARLRSVRSAGVWTWDGKTYNKGNKRRWECIEYVRFSADTRPKDVADVYKRLYFSENVQVRTV